MNTSYKNIPLAIGSLPPANTALLILRQLELLESPSSLASWCLDGLYHWVCYNYDGILILGKIS